MGQRCAVPQPIATQCPSVRGAAAGGSGRQRCSQAPLAQCDSCHTVPGVPLVSAPPSQTSLQRRTSGGLCRQACACKRMPVYAGRRQGRSAAGWVRQCSGTDQGHAWHGVMLWAVPGVPLQCPTHPASLRDTSGGLWDRHRCKRIATEAAGGAPLQRRPAGSGAARNACRCDAMRCASAASAVPHPPSLTEVSLQ